MNQNWAQWVLGVVSYEWNQLDAAVYHFSSVLADRHRAHAYTVQEAMYGLAFAYHAFLAAAGGKPGEKLSTSG